MPDTAQNIRVVTRIRPLNSSEKSQGCDDILVVNPSEEKVATQSLHIKNDPQKLYTYDSIFSPTTSTDEVYKAVMKDDIKEKLLEGLNLTVLAYGQTGSGKTFTMGTNYDTKSGIIPSAVTSLFKSISSLKDSNVTIKMSYLEIYNEEIKDLLATNSDDKRVLKVCENLGGEVSVSNLSYVPVTCPEQVSTLMQSASLNRATGSTNMNAVSSRSHAICTIYVERTKNDGSDVVVSKLSLVDLAGSERQKRTKAEGERLKEGISINKGLFVLGQVVSSLSDPNAGANNHVPYRDSKLTRLLTDSLGGNSLTVMVCCVSPADINLDESSNTLRYAMRARNIKNEATVNTVTVAITQQEAAKLRRENQVLKLQLLQAQMEQKVVVGEGGVEGAQYSVPGSVIDLDRLDIVMKLRSENASLRTRVVQNEKRVGDAAEETLQASLTADKWKFKYEQVLEMGRLQGVKIDTEHFQENETVEEMRLEIERLKGEVRDARVEAEVAKATAEAIVVGDGNLTAVEEMALKNHEENVLKSEDVGQTKISVKMATELNAISGNIHEKEKMAEQLFRERESMETLKSHFTEAMKSLQEEVEVLNNERSSLISKIDSKEEKAASIPTQMKLKGRLSELQERIKKLQSKSAEHAKSLRLRDIAEKKCQALKAEITEDKKRKAALQRRMKEEAEGRRNEKKAAEIKAMKLLREGDKLKAELNRVREAAAKQANVLKRKATEALAKQRNEAEKRKRLGKDNNGINSTSNNSSGATVNLDRVRKGQLNEWIGREIENMAMVQSTKEQLNEQATLRANAARKRETLTGKKGIFGIGQQVKLLDMEVDTRTGVICQLQRSLMELEREAKTNVIPGMTGVVERFVGLSKTECRFMLHNIFDNLISTKYQVERLTATANVRDTEAVEAAVELERKKNKEIVKKLKYEHSEAIMSLMEATKGAVEHKVGMQIMEAAGSAGGIIDPELKSTVDDMLGGFLDGFSKVGDELFTEFEAMKEDDRKEKERIELKKEREKEKKKMKKVVWKPPVEEEEDEEDDFIDAGEMTDDDSDWGETPVKKKTKVKKEKGRKEKEKEDLDKSIIEEEIVQMLDDDHEETGGVIEEAKLRKMKVAELKAELKKRGLLVGGKKDDLVNRLLESFGQLGGGNANANAGVGGGNNMMDISTSSESSERSERSESSGGGESSESGEESSGGTPYAKKVRNKEVEARVEAKANVEAKMDVKVDVKVAPKVEVKVEAKAETKKAASEPYWKSVSTSASATTTTNNNVVKNKPIAAATTEPAQDKDDRMQRLKEWRLKQQQGGQQGKPNLKRSASSGSDDTGAKKVRREAMSNVLNKLDTFTKEMGFAEKKKTPTGTGLGVSGLGGPVKKPLPKWN
ncbi:hypothetical protein TrST_g13517 [Triparma strigata]|uniref:Kinesin motor domain-containing protein n=1 Tax=Triparma strigata TaxID=1606541 RepID=A0A9W7E9I8_9STRA|nr:hypothetical protein TrST_g13517 [Triparma strigata]